MQVLILGDGFSIRLYPLTTYFPKALLPVRVRLEVIIRHNSCRI